MELIIAEKPSVARDLARVLGMKPAGKGAYEGNGRVITWCVGHLVELGGTIAVEAAQSAHGRAPRLRLPVEDTARPQAVERAADL